MRKQNITEYLADVSEGETQEEMNTWLAECEKTINNCIEDCNNSNNDYPNYKTSNVLNNRKRNIRNLRIPMTTPSKKKAKHSNPRNMNVSKNRRTHNRNSYGIDDMDEILWKDLDHTNGQNTNKKSNKNKQQILMHSKLNYSRNKNQNNNIHGRTQMNSYSTNSNKNIFNNYSNLNINSKPRSKHRGRKSIRTNMNIRNNTNNNKYKNNHSSDFGRPSLNYNPFNSSINRHSNTINTSHNDSILNNNNLKPTNTNTNTNNLVRKRPTRNHKRHNNSSLFLSPNNNINTRDTFETLANINNNININENNSNTNINENKNGYNKLEKLIVSEFNNTNKSIDKLKDDINEIKDNIHENNSIDVNECEVLSSLKISRMKENRQQWNSIRYFSGAINHPSLQHKVNINYNNYSAIPVYTGNLKPNNQAFFDMIEKDNGVLFNRIIHRTNIQTDINKYKHFIPPLNSQCYLIVLKENTNYFWYGLLNDVVVTNFNVHEHPKMKKYLTNEYRMYSLCYKRCNKRIGMEFMKGWCNATYPKEWNYIAFFFVSKNN